MRSLSKEGLGMFGISLLRRRTCGALRHKRRLLPVLAYMLAVGTAGGQWSAAPSDATVSLSFNTVAAGDDPVSTAFPTFPANCTGNNGPFTFANATSFTSITDDRPYPLCAYEVPAPNGAFLPPNDMWFRLDPTTGTGGAQRDFRFTIIPGSTPGAGDYAGIAVYEASSASSPMTLLDCSRDGGYKTAAQRGPSVEATCITPGYKLYVRVWTYQSASPNFSLCVMNRTKGTYPNVRYAEETACTAPNVPLDGAWKTINYVFSCREPGFILPQDRSDGGDLWVKATVPANGHLSIQTAYGSSGATSVAGASGGTQNLADQHVGVTAYLSDNCADAAQFHELGHVDKLVPGIGTFSTYNMNLRCLPPGATVYLRIHSVRDGGTVRSLRYGQLRIRMLQGSDMVDPGGQSQPCGALSIAVGATCTGLVQGDNVNRCSYPGVPEPTCGNFNSLKASVWYKFEAPISGLVQIDAGAGPAPAMNRPAIALYASNAGPSDPGQGCRDRLSLMACDDRQGEGANARIIKGGLVPGKVYYLRVWSTGTDGTFTLCVTSPEPPAGHCWYMVEFWAGYVNNPYNNPNVPSVTVTIPPGPGGTATTYTTHGNDQSEVFLVAVPGATGAHFQFSFTATGAFYRALWNPYGGGPLMQHAVSGGGEVGPGTAPVTQYTVPGCNVQQHYTSDCFGVQTLCINGTVGDPAYYGPFNGWTGSYYLNQFGYNNTVHPSSSSGNPITNTGSTYYHPSWGSRMDLAGANMGCLEGESQGIQWYVFRPTTDGTLGFAIRGWRTNGPAVAIDVDFAVWDVGALDYNMPPDPDHINGYDICPPQDPPVRCSSARVVAATGLAPYTSQEVEGQGGHGWVTPLPVQAGHGYLLAITPVGTTGTLRNDIFWYLFKDEQGQTVPGMLDCNSLVLPVELLFLDGWARGQDVDLTWATASERNSSHFVVEHSRDAIHFTPVGEVAAAGDSQHRVDYGFTDRDPGVGIHYYRLRQVDRDGTFEYSNMVAVPLLDSGARLVAWPNPVQDRLQVQGGPEGGASMAVSVLNILGQTVREAVVQTDGGRLDVDTGGLSPGTYMLQLHDMEGNEAGMVRFVKQ